MKRLGRWVLNAATGLSLVLCLAVGAAWVRSYELSDELRFQGRDGMTERFLATPRGGLYVSQLRFCQPRDPGSWEPGFSYYTEEAQGVAPLALTFLGFGWEQRAGRAPDVSSVTKCLVPLRYLGALFAVLPAVRLYRRAKRKKRFAPGHCKHCGYDLRATPGRCPECGAVPAAAVQTGLSTQD